MSYKDVDDVIRENYQLEKENEELKEKIEEEKRKEEKGNELIKDEELDKIKKELDERKEELKRKDKKYREIKRGYKNNKTYFIIIKRLGLNNEKITNNTRNFGLY